MPKIKKCLSTEEPMRVKNKQINKKQALCSALNEKKENQIRTYSMEISVIYELPTKGYSKLQNFPNILILFLQMYVKG